MESEAKYALVGTGVLILIAAMVGAIVWLRSASGRADVTTYKIYFARQSLDGVHLRSDVKMKGIVVGAVSSFRISDWRPGSVEVVVRVDDSVPVRQSTKAVVERQLLTGIASIRLINPTGDSPPLTQKLEGELYPVIAEGESELEQFSQSIAQLAERADDTLRRANALMSEENRAALSQTLVNVQRITASAERGMQGLDRTLASVSGAADQVQSMAADLSASAGQFVSRYDDLGQEATAAVREVRVSVRDVRASLDQMAADVARLTARADVLLADGSAELTGTAQALQSTADSLGMAARRFRDPRAILFGPAAGELGPGESAR